MHLLQVYREVADEPGSKEKIQLLVKAIFKEFSVRDHSVHVLSGDGGGGGGGGGGVCVCMRARACVCVFACACASSKYTFVFPP